MDSNNFFTLESFELEVEHKKHLYDNSYIDTIIDLFDQYGIEPEDGNEYISNLLRIKIENEAMKLKQIKYRKKQSNFDLIFG